MKLYFIIITITLFQLEDGEATQQGELENKAIERFLEIAMRNYSTWLRSFDPSPVITASLNLSDNNDEDNVDLTLFEITNQFIKGHSYPNNSLIYSASNFNMKSFIVSREGLFRDSVTFSGDYIAKGEIAILKEEGAVRKINFTGQGMWTFKSNTSYEAISCSNYVVNDNGYIDLGQADTENYQYDITEVELEFQFEGLQLLEAVDTPEKYLKSIERGLANLYVVFLKHPEDAGAEESQRSLKPTKGLLISYLTAIFSETTISEMVDRMINPSEATIAIDSFLWLAMRNYTKWLNSFDPSPIITEPLHLQQVNSSENLPELILNITNQRMRGHSNPGFVIFTGVSNFTERSFKVTHAGSFEDMLVLWGNYVASGTIKVVNRNGVERNVPFSGQGPWSVKANGSFEGYTCSKFGVNEDGYIIFAHENTVDNYSYNLINIKEFQFEEIQLLEPVDEEDDVEKYLKIIETGLANLYINFLRNSTGAQEEPSGLLIPSKRLLDTYLTDMFLETTLNEMIEKIRVPATDSPEIGLGTIMNGSKFVIFLSQVCCMVFISSVTL